MYSVHEFCVHYVQMYRDKSKIINFKFYNLIKLHRLTQYTLHIPNEIHNSNKMYTMLNLVNCLC